MIFRDNNHCTFTDICRNNKCFWRQISLGYVPFATSQADKNRNQDIERSMGKNYFPKMNIIQDETGIKIDCREYKDG